MARLAERIRQARRQSGLSQEALAERIGVPPDRLRGYEEGANVTARQLELIAVATGRPLSYFVDGAEPASDGAGGVRARLRAAIAWLSEPVGAEADGEARLAEVVERERRFEHELEAERAKRIALEAKVNELTALLREREPRARGRQDEAAAALAERQRALAEQARALAQERRRLEDLRSRLEAREEEVGRKSEALGAQETELERLREALQEREREFAAMQPSTAPARAPAGESAPAEAAGYNLTTLERLVAQRESDVPARREEWRAYIGFLREFAHADGNLPPTFNTLVREVFRELLG